MTELSYPVRGNPDTAMHAPRATKPVDVTAWRRGKGWLALAEVATALQVDVADVEQLIRDGKLHARWYRSDVGPVAVVTRKEVQHYARRPVTDDQLGGDPLVGDRVPADAECPDCGQMIPLSSKSLLLKHNRPDGTRCPGGRGIERRFTIPRAKRAVVVPPDADLDDWFEKHGLLTLEEALEDVELPDDVVAVAIERNLLRCRWVRIDGVPTVVVEERGVLALAGLANQADYMKVPVTELLQGQLPLLGAAVVAPSDDDEFGTFCDDREAIPLDDIADVFDGWTHADVAWQFREKRFGPSWWFITGGVWVLCVGSRRPERAGPTRRDWRRRSR